MKFRVLTQADVPVHGAVGAPVKVEEGRALLAVRASGGPCVEPGHFIAVGGPAERDRNIRVPYLEQNSIQHMNMNMKDVIRVEL